MKDYLLSFVNQALEADFDRLPNVVYFHKLKRALEKNSPFDATDSDIEFEIVETILGNMSVNFSALGMECSEEDEEFLAELANGISQIVWKMYAHIIPELGREVFLGQIKGFDLSLT